MIRAVIVDDEAPARDRLHRLLAGKVDVVGEAGDGHEALARIAELAPDVVFLDIQMPGPSGLEVAARLRAPRPRIVFCTAFDQFAIDAFEHHAVDYLLKPVNSERLARTVDRMCRQIEEQRIRVREEREAARTQARLMPEAPPPIRGLDYAAFYRPASGVGGDYYDFLPLGGERLGLALGDVSGKGTYAGLLVAALQARMQALVAGRVTEPALVLEALNRLTVGKMEGNRFATLFFATYDGNTRALTFANAGHPPALLVAGTGNVTELAPTGPVIGWSADAAYEQRTVTLSPADTLVVFSDGINEAGAASGREFGVDALTQVILRDRDRDAAGLVAALTEEIDRFTAGAPPDDDRTLVVARVVS
jgi:sigma-B regulation protein RsbU (phosphoserine phosphatase)